MNEERFLKAYQEVQVLIDTFEENESIYKDTSKYSEAEVRTDYIDKFYIALGWDVRHEQQTNPFEQEVKVEVSQRQEGESGSKRADYAFYLAPNYKQPQFFVEAKQPSKALKNNKDFYFQTAKYGWNAGTGVSILTDFEEIVVINCILKPNYEEILKCKLLSFQYKDFRDKEVFRKFYDIFSHDAVQEGKLRDYVKGITNGDINETVSIDNTFLKYIEENRLEMAQAIHAKNPDYDSYELTEATQKVIDRLVFMRFLEDKNIESENILYTISTDKDPWDRMMKRSAELDSKYNGIVFKPSILEDAKFKGVDIEKFRAIAQDLDHKHTPFDFNYIPIHILGTIYERFLGNIIVIEQGDIDIQMKPEVRKAGGVFYTPQYIVDYIVQNTIGKLIEGKKPEDIAQLKFADIACGSGSFLIGAYEYLLDYHTKYYNDNPKVAEKAGCILDKKTQKYVLSIKQKQDILKNNIYGVDIDHQATEVTQMSLFLKLLEDETMATANQMQTLFKTEILPDMSENIKCGNSLIGREIRNVLNLDELEKEMRRKLKPFSFERSFKKVFGTNGDGFDAIIGNPPYVKEYTNREAFENVKLGKLAKYYQGKMDLWYFFACYGLDLLKENGYLGYIAPNQWVSNAGASILRNKVLSDSTIKELIDFKSFMVFDQASIQTMIMLLQKNKSAEAYTMKNKVFYASKLTHELVAEELHKDTSNYSFNSNVNLVRKEYKNKYLKFISEREKPIIEKIKKAANFVLDNNEMTNGIHPHFDFVQRKMVDKFPNLNVGDGIFGLSHQEKESLGLSEDELKLIKPYYTTEELARYYANPNNRYWLIYTNSSFKNPTSMDQYPNLKAHLDKYSEVITSDFKPYGLHRTRKESFFIGEKIISKRMCPSEPAFTYCDFDSYVSATFYVIQSKRINLKYLTGLLNSSLIKYWLLRKGKMTGDSFQVDKAPLLEIPICLTENQALHDELVALVDKMIKAKKDEIEAQATAFSSTDLEYYTEIVEDLEEDINSKVYEIYGLSEEEIAIIE